MKTFVVIAFVASFVSIVMACGDISAPSRQPIALEEDASLTRALQRIAHGFVEQRVGEELVYLRTSDELRSFWQRFEASEPPQVDFGRYDVIVVLMGTQRSGGYFVRIVSAVEDGRGLRVKTLFCTPPEGTSQIAEVTSPFDAKLIAKNNGGIALEKIEGRTGDGACR